MTHFATVSSLLLNIFTLTIGICAALIICACGLLYIRGATYKAQGEVNKSQEESIRQLRERIANLEGMMRMQDRRLHRSELEAQRKERLLLAARQEIEFFEDVVRIVLPLLGRMAPEEKLRADAIMKSLAQFRRDSTRKQTEWEETKDALAIYMDGVDDPSLAAAPVVK